MATGPSLRAGRNDACPCGSGKKYKRCCLAKAAAEEAVWARARGASDNLSRELLRYADRKFGARFEEAWEDFYLGEPDQPYGPDFGEGPIFFPYFLFHWKPHEIGWRKRDDTPGGVVAKAFLLENSGRLSDMERLILEQSVVQPLSFYEVLSSERGERIFLRDILTGQETQVRERKGSTAVEEGDIIFAQILALQGITMLGCCAPLKIPPKMKGDVVALRKRLRRKTKRENGEISTADLVRFADDIRAVYLNIRDYLHAPPRVCNTDGDPLAFHTLTFEIESLEAAFEALAPLAKGVPKSDLLWDAECDAEGKLRKVEFDWLKKGNRRIKSWENTILGTIRLADRSLVAEVNSENRAVRLRSEIEKRLGAAAVHKSTVSRAYEEMLQKAAEESPSDEKERDRELEELLRDPAVREQMRESIQKQIEAWVHQKVPALGGRTPIQAVKDPDGREIVEALLTQFERQDKKTFPGAIRPDIGPLRRLLGLPKTNP